MKTILKLLIVAIVLNACARGSLAVMRYYQFKETAQQAVLFGATDAPVVIQQRILERARELKLPVAPENVHVNRQGGRTWADAMYRDEIEFFPNQKYAVDFSFSVEGHSMVL